MSALFSARWLQRLHSHRSLEATPPVGGTHTRPGCPPEGPTGDGEHPSDTGADDMHSACGWYESSHELHRGLAVAEWPESDDAVAALWFGRPVAMPTSGAVH
jgi:hypothetical protein